MWEFLPSHFATLGSENVFVLHQKIRKTSQKMSESTIDSNENEKKRDIIFGACHHNIKKISQLVSEFDSVFNLSPTSRRCSTFDQWLCWSTFVSNHGRRTELKRHLRMSLTSFEKLLSFIRQSLKVDMAMAQLRGGVIIPEIALYCTLCYIAGGLYTDRFFCWDI